MNIFDIADKDLEISIDGPGSGYKYEYNAQFTNEREVVVDISVNDILLGNQNEEAIIILDEDKFVSSVGAYLENNQTSGYLNQILSGEGVIESAGTATTAVLGITMGILIATNVLLGDQLELHWAFLNTLQIIYYFPYLNLYFPEHLTLFLDSFGISQLRLNLAFYNDVQSKIASGILISGINNDKFEQNGFETASLLVNITPIIITLFQGFITCFIMLAIRSKFVTIPKEIKLQEELSINENIPHRDDIQNDISNSVVTDNMHSQADQSSRVVLDNPHSLRLEENKDSLRSNQTIENREIQKEPTQHKK